MIDLNKIGVRIKEQRKYIAKVSQEKMAEDLQMYQADISNIEKAKSGSGITDITKLDMIAEYFDIPLESLLFGSKKKMQKYLGSKMKLKLSKKEPSKAKFPILQKLIGTNDITQIPAIVLECGDYYLYSIVEIQGAFNPNTTEQPVDLQKLHTYIFYGDELTAVMTTTITAMMEHIFKRDFDKLCSIMQPDVINPSDFYRLVNPYWALYTHSEKANEKQEYKSKMYARMDALRSAGEDRPVFYIESVYVREDYRQNGIFRMFIDMLKFVFKGCILWLNMEPTSGSELDDSYNCVTTYSVSELGQLNLNASISEKLGFKVSAESYCRQAETLDDDVIHVEPVQVRKYAYYFPKEIREIIKDDNDLVEQGYAKQKLRESNENEKHIIADMNSSKKDGYCIFELMETHTAGPTKGLRICFFAAYSPEQDKYRFGISHRSVILEGLNHESKIAEYEYLDDAVDSEYFEQLTLANQMLHFNFGSEIN